MNKSVEQEIEEGFTPVNNEMPKFWDFETQGAFIGKFEKKFSWNPDNNEKPDWEANTFSDKQGFKWNLPTSYQIEKAIEKEGVKVYRIEFIGKKKLEGGRSVNEYAISTKDATAW